MAKQQGASFRLDQTRTGCGGCLGVVLLAGLVWLGVAVSTGGDDQPARPAASPSVPTHTATLSAAPTAQVPWDDYDESVKQRIDAMGQASECAGLQAEFEAADGNNVATMNRTGHNNADLMAYINEWMEMAGCYE